MLKIVLANPCKRCHAMIILAICDGVNGALAAPNAEEVFKRLGLNVRPMPEMLGSIVRAWWITKRPTLLNGCETATPGTKAIAQGTFETLFGLVQFWMLFF